MSEIKTSVHLPAEFTRAHRQAIQNYWLGQESVSGSEWLALIQAMNVLRRAELVYPEQSESFAAIYDRYVDAVYSDKFIERLLGLPDPEKDSEPLRAAVSRQIMGDLRKAGLRQSGVPDLQLLAAFCLYWWRMFVRGYAFEIAIYRDLTHSQIAYTAHDLRNRSARLAGHDLELMGFKGDIKTSAYFALFYPTEKLALDFYITRMYHAHAHRWHRLVWLKPSCWRVLNGEPTRVAYEAIWQVLPGVAQIALRGREFVVVEYAEWKQRVMARQPQEVK